MEDKNLAFGTDLGRHCGECNVGIKGGNLRR